MNEKARLQDLLAYRILDTPPESIFDEIVEFASMAFQAPIALISFMDADRQWFKAKAGVQISELPRKEALCASVLTTPHDLLVVNDATKGERFLHNPLVINKHPVRFYAAAPLISPQGNVLGSLCIADYKRRSCTQWQRKLLKRLAEKVIEKLASRKLTYQAQQDQDLRKEFLYKLTEHAPVIIFVMEIKPDGKVSFPFVSPTLSRLFPDMTAEMLEKDGSLLFRQVYPEDREKFMEDTTDSKQNLADWEVKYRVQSADGSFRWHWSKARPEKRPDGTLVYYGATMDITESQEYVQTIEKILFDISHVLRRPVSTLLGLADMMHDPIAQEDIADLALHFKTVAEEMDTYIKNLNETYYQKRLEIEGKGA